MNQIGNIEFDFRMQNETFAQDLYARWDRFFDQSIEPIVDAVLAGYDCDSGVIEIEQLNIDLGIIPEATFDDLFPLILREKLEEALLAYLYHTDQDYRPEQLPKATISEADQAFELLAYFLLHGNLLWHADPKYKNIAVLFMEVIRTNGKKFKQFLLTYGHYTSLQERLAYQLDDPELEEGIRLISPAESTYIVSYVKMLSSKYKSISKPLIRETTYRNTIWRVVYAYLLTNRSSYFNRKAFIRQTLSGLAAGINVTYDYLLDLLIDKTDVRAAGKENISEEFYRILSELKEEVTQALFDSIAVDPVRLYKTLEEILCSDLNVLVGRPTYEALENILSKPDTCRIFLQYLKEEEIIGLVPVVIPRDSQFVVIYAGLLDRQKEQGGLAGKAGGEFRTLKWQVIFPLLFENRGSSLNRKYFVISVLRQIAAHYNLYVIELVSYFNQSELLPDMDRELKTIFSQLYTELKTADGEMDRISIATTGVSDQPLRNQEEAADRQQEALLKTLCNKESRKKLFETITEEEQKEVIRMFYKQESEFILSYAYSLEKQEKTRLLEGKAGGGFRQLKWEFIWAVLSKDNYTGFNRKYFVMGVLKKLASHYNLSYAELLSYFYTGKAFRQFPPEIQAILYTLYQDEMEQFIRQSVSVLNEKSKQALLTTLVQLSGAVPKRFIMDYLHFLTACKEAGILPQISASEFNTAIWKQTAGLLFYAGNRNHLDKYGFVKQLLEYIARHYKISLTDLVNELQEQVTQLENIPSELQRIQHEIYSEKIYSPDKMFNLKDEIMEKIENVYVENAGIVLLSHWFHRLFSMLGLTENNKFKSKDAQVKAIYVIQHAIYEKTDFPEHELLLNKIMVGWDMKDAVPADVELTEDEKKTTMSMVEGAKNNWPKLKNTSLEGIKQAFLQRAGKLEETEEFYKLTVEEKAYDILLDSLPWNFRIIKFPWMGKRMEVKWR